MNDVDPFSFHPIDRVIIARVVVDNSEPDIVLSEISKKVDYILDVDNNDKPLYVNDRYVDIIYNALRNSLLYSDLLTNPHSAFMMKIDRILTDTWNTQSDVENGIVTFLTRSGINPATQPEVENRPDSPLPKPDPPLFSPRNAGSRRKRNCSKKRKLKQTKRKRR